MALIDLQNQVNVVNCDAGNVLGTGLASCPFDWDRIETVIFTNRNFKLSDEITLEYVQENQQLGNLIVVKGYESFTQNTPEPNINTVDGSGFKQVMGEMPTEFTGVLNNGVINWKALRTLNGKDKFNCIFVDVSGNIVFTQTKSGEFKGFGLKMLFTGTYKGKEGNTPSMYTQNLQFSDYMEMERMQWVTGSSLDFTPSELDGVNDVDIAIDPIAVGATAIVFKPTLLDKTHLVEGLTLANLSVKKNGVAITPSAISYTTNVGKITLTITAAVAGDIYTIDLVDSLLPNSQAINIAGTLYKSDAKTAIVSA